MTRLHWNLLFTGRLVIVETGVFVGELLPEVFGSVAEVALMEMMTSIIDAFVCPGPNDTKEPGDIMAQTR